MSEASGWGILLMKRLLAIGLCLLPIAALADPTNLQDVVTSETLSTASGNCIQPNPLRRSLMIDNTGNAIIVGYCEMANVPPGQQGTACTAAIGSAGTTSVAANSNFFWPAGSAPTNGLCFIAASGTPIINVREGM